MTTFGIEEEFQFLDPHSLQPANIAAGAIERLLNDPDWRGVTHKEFLASQVEHASTVFTSIEDGTGGAPRLPSRHVGARR